MSIRSHMRDKVIVFGWQLILLAAMGVVMLFARQPWLAAGSFLLAIATVRIRKAA